MVQKKSTSLTFFCLFLLLCIIPSFSVAQQPNTAKPWAYWWWLGSAVNKEGISKNLVDYQKAGFGGLHIIPIYGVKGQEANFINYLSPKWLEMLAFTLEEAHRLGLGIDMTLGTGWPYGGSHVPPEDAAKQFQIKQVEGKYRLEVLNTNQKVKRAAPGGEGLVIDHLSKSAIENYLGPFEAHFKAKSYKVRAFYNDSYEVYGANWTPHFFEKFKKLRHYDLAEHLDVLAKQNAETEREKRIWSDYHETLSDILRDDFTKSITDFSHQFGKIFRNEAHGSPANVLDIYAASDIPESEFFGSKPYDIPLYRQDPDYEESRFGRPDVLVLKLASSAANITGKKLVSSETATWLGNHFKVSLSQIKPIIDESFLGGINHVFYHGIPYSPPNATWPGWLFYASTNFNQQSHFWNELPLLNDYITRCQTMLQTSKSDNDVLVYLPFYDLWHTSGRVVKTHPIDVHQLLKGDLFNEKLKTTVQDLTKAGYSYDFISDLQIVHLQVDKNKNTITEGKASYQVIVIPSCTYMSLSTLKKLNELKNKGAKLVFVEKLAEKVNGFFEYETRQKFFDKIRANLALNVSSDFLETLSKNKIRREELTEKGLSFIRKKRPEGQMYFISNLSNKFTNGRVKLATSGNRMYLNYPLQRQSKFIPFQKISKNLIEFNLELLPGQSAVIQIVKEKNSIDFKNAISSRIRKQHLTPSEITLTKQTQPLNGLWNVEFVKGEPFLPLPYKTQSLTSWTTQPDTMAQYFSGTARYSTTFEINDQELRKTIWLDLGDVRETAKVKINGRPIGTAWCLPFRLSIPTELLQKRNNIEIEVTNLSANRIRYLDKTKTDWKNFYDINMVDIRYQPFDASQWLPTPSGLLGPVQIEWR